MEIRRHGKLNNTGKKISAVSRRCVVVNYMDSVATFEYYKDKQMCKLRADLKKRGIPFPKNAGIRELKRISYRYKRLYNK
uniref:hypothetical protein n=1 Tax=Ornithobacterium rhinotracheale TaxID=28251 RepID=UPI0039A6B64C